MNRNAIFGLSSWARTAADLASPDRLSEWGMHTLVEKAEDSPDAIDVVAVHGLNGHWNKTWTDEATGTNWLKTLIPLRLKTARVMSFAYNSSVQFSKSVSDVADFADQLLESVLSVRRSANEEERPLVFICHSLGGIVFKQACNRAHESNRFRLLRKSIAGVIFFGTPHQGSSIASLGKILSRILKACTLGMSTNSQLLQNLERGSLALNHISTLFNDRAYQFKIYSFYETDKMTFMNTLVVERESAVLGIKQEVAAPMNGNHRTMCRFSTNDKRVDLVLGDLAEMVRIWRGKNTDHTEWQFLNTIGISNHVLHKDRNPSPVKGTCSWVLKHPEFKRWYEAEGSALMWLSANPGCGKSVMTSFLIDHFQTTTVQKRVHVCYWFFKSDNSEQRSALLALRGMLRQILKARTDVISIIKKEAQEKIMDTLEAFWGLFVRAVEERPSIKSDNDDTTRSADSDRPMTICLIDGLDECETELKKELIRLIQTYFQDLEDNDKAVKQDKGLMKILIASRPENWIKVAIDRMKPRRSKLAPVQSRSEKPVSSTPYCVIRLKGEDESGFISGDISLVVRATIADLVDQGFPESLLKGIQELLIARADRTFIWITLILGLLRDKVEAGASRRELENILESRSIDQIFAELLETRPDAPRTRKMFSILLAAARPLKVDELSLALALTPEYDALDKSSKIFRPGPQNFEAVEYDLVYPFENHIRSLGGHFIRIIRNEVYFVHETAREFLLGRSKPVETLRPLQYDAVNLVQDDDGSMIAKPQSTWRHSFPYRACQALLLDLCVTYLYLVGQLASKNEEVTGERAIFLDYASRAWFMHFSGVIKFINSHHLRYYQNICHPKFPGFVIWTEILQRKKAVVDPTIGLSDDEKQDYYIQTLGLDPLQQSDSSDDDEDGGSAEFIFDDYSDNGHKNDDHDEEDSMKPAARDEDDGTKDMAKDQARRRLRPKDFALSSNPTARLNHNFPLFVDDNGFVSLDHDAFSKHSY